MGVVRGAAVAVVLGVLLAAGCTSGEPDPPGPLQPQWRELSLPVPAGDFQRVILRDVVTCAGVWYAAGALADADGATLPAAWRSTDGEAWTALPTTAHTYWGRQHVLYSAACRDGVLAVLGAKSGGAHAYPRTGNWRQHPDGSLEEVIVGYTLYGGATSLNVGRMVGGGPGWAIAGNRGSGAAVWLSEDGVEFQLFEAAPGLATDDRGATWMFDVVATADGWLLLGGITPRGRIDRDPLAWRSVNDSWSRMEVSAGEQYEEFQRGVAVDQVVYAVGLAGGEFGSWRLDGQGWTALPGFGETGAGGIPRVLSVAAVDGRLFAAVNQASTHVVWTSDRVVETWRPVDLPVEIKTTSESAAALAGDSTTLLLAIDDGQSGRLWVSEIAEP